MYFVDGEELMHSFNAGSKRRGSSCENDQLCVQEGREEGRDILCDICECIVFP